MSVTPIYIGEPQGENLGVDAYLLSTAATDLLWSTPYSYSSQAPFLRFFQQPSLNMINATDGRWSVIIDGLIDEDFVILSARDGNDSSVWLLYTNAAIFANNGTVVPIYKQASCSIFNRVFNIDGGYVPGTGFLAKATKLSNGKILAVIDSDEGWIGLSWDAANPLASPPEIMFRMYQTGARLDGTGRVGELRGYSLNSDPQYPISPTLFYAAARTSLGLSFTYDLIIDSSGSFEIVNDLEPCPSSYRFQASMVDGVGILTGRGSFPTVYYNITAHKSFPICTQHIFQSPPPPFFTKKFLSVRHWRVFWCHCQFCDDPSRHFHPCTPFDFEYGPH